MTHSSTVARKAPEARRERPYVQELARLAVKSLYAELVLYPKPGLVSPEDSGAHSDMTACTFMRSLFALRRYFVEIAEAGTRKARMSELRRLGLAAEARMLRATGGINTHRGAIFTLGLLTASAALAASERRGPTDATLRDLIASNWRRDLIATDTAMSGASTHGLQMAARFGVSGARGEAINGFPSVFEVALPALREAIARGLEFRIAQIHAFFALLAVVDDTNVLYRGGRDGALHLRRAATAFNGAGSVFAPSWRARAESLHRSCSALRLSPGGCADLLAGTIFVHRLQMARR